mmetsp:Transcript_37168/g.91873  ORF Transcript_37168/g.91873 Transcript_37168/m.91873 type:complete len:213 (-) Transcript_37168:465-1103(-)
MDAVMMPSTSCRLGAMSNRNMDTTMVTIIAMEVEYTLTMVSAYFMIHDTSRPVKARLHTTAQVTTSYPRSSVCGSSVNPLLNPAFTSSTSSRAALKMTPKLYSCRFCQYRLSSFIFISFSVYTPASALRHALSMPSMYPMVGAARPPPQPIWLVVAPIMSSASAIHCSLLSCRLSITRNRMPVVTIFRLPRIWYVAGSTYFSVMNCTLLCTR